MAENLTCKLDKQGRILLPAKWRKQHGIEPKSELLMELRDDCLVLQTREQAVREAQEMVHRLVPPGKSLVDGLSKQRRREALEESAVGARHLAPGKRSSKEQTATALAAPRPNRRRVRARR
jgi:bifunctional DNA-binding transcriptional regulator/antitoxin component of YhaV-PrlF toxin-antitoxin module